MPVLTLSISGLVFFVVTLAIMVLFTPRGASVRARLDGYARTSELGDSGGRPSPSFFQRLLLPVFHRFAAATTSVAPTFAMQQTANNLEKAGYAGRIPPGTFLLLKVALLVALPGVYGFYLWHGGAPGLLQLVIVLALFFVGYRAPDWWLEMQIDERRSAITRALPDALDLMVICIEAGLGFEAALGRVVERTKGPLSEELRRALSEMSMGKRRREALRDMADRCQSRDLGSFIAVVVQADQTGVSIGQVLKVQADALRVRRMQRAKEEGAKAPLKMLIPMIFFILPATFAVIVGPAALRVIDAFAEVGMSR
ncbi:MAG TPA: type II secretion system F family protein [Dehalococcoidia bacterium]|nr:type II secretion system F family protein [Dehalococcoidia bacterium]